MDPQTVQLLREEYFYLQKTIEDFDSRLLTLKSWSVTFSLTAIGAAFSAKAPAVFLVSAVGSILFWVLEVLWKGFQLAYHQRVHELEEVFRTPDKDLAPLQISSSWGRSYRGLTTEKHWGFAMWPNVWIPHLPITFLALALFALWAAGLLRI